MIIAYLLITIAGALVFDATQSAEVFGQDATGAAQEWRTVYDELFFSSPGERSEAEREELVEQLIAKMNNMLSTIDWRFSAISENEFEFARKTFSKMTKRDICDVQARKNIDSLREEILSHRRRSELNTDDQEDEAGLLIDQYLEDTVEAQLAKCTARILNLRDLVRKSMDVADWRRIYRIFWINKHFRDDYDRTNEFVRDTAKILHDQCHPRHSLIQKILSFKQNDPTRTCYISLYEDTCKKITDLHERETTYEGEPDIASILQAHRECLLGLEMVDTVNEFIGLRDACIGTSFSVLFERVHDQLREVKTMAAQIN